MSDNKNIDVPPEKQLDVSDNKLQAASEASSVGGSVSAKKITTSADRQIKFERAQRCLENAALVSKRIKEHRKATAELLGKPFEDDEGDNASEMASAISERTGYSIATDISAPLSVQDALNIPGISESLANTLKQKEILMERIKQYKEISKRPAKSLTPRKELKTETKSNIEIKKSIDSTDAVQLANTIKDKENALSVLQVKMKAMETTILDLQEKINEKDQIIEAKNMATVLMSDKLSKKEKDSFELLEDTKQQMTKMQEHFLTMESEWKAEKQRLLLDLQHKGDRIKTLEEANDILENARFEISLTNSKLLEDIEIKNQEILSLENTIQNLSQLNVVESPEKEDIEVEKGALEISGMAELTKRIELLEQINCQIRQTNKELENKLSGMSSEQKHSAVVSPSKKGSPLPSRKGARGTSSKMKSPWTQLSSESLPQESDKKQIKNEIARLEALVQSLNKDILDREIVISQKDELIVQLESNKNQENKSLVDVCVATELTDEIVLKNLDNKNEKDEHTLEKKVSEENQSDDIIKLQEQLKFAEEQIAQLNQDIDEANKNMIKVKSSNKIKIKQMQKTIDNFSKVSDANAEIIKLNEQLHQLSQKVAEVEEEKGNLQLHLVDYDSGRLTESDIYKKMVEMENLAEARLRSISILETQKLDLVQELHNIQLKYTEIEDKLADLSQLQSDQVTSEIKSVQLEEQIDELTASRKELELVIANLKLDKDEMNSTIKILTEEKDELIHKLENYIQENMELTDKLEKLSAEKVSSAESIEIVDSLTTQEKLELEEYTKGKVDNKTEDCEVKTPAVPKEENLENLLEQTDELNKKIELFEQERQEVMEKMNNLSSENEILNFKINELSNERTLLQNNIDLFSSEKNTLLLLNQELNLEIENLKRERVELMKGTLEITKPSDEVTETVAVETHDEKISDKGLNRTRTVKQMTKEILKLKNIIKEREADIADCQMKILSLEEQEQKKSNLLQNIATYETKLKHLSDENNQLREELGIIRTKQQSDEDLSQYKSTIEKLQLEVQRIHQEYLATIHSKDTTITELEQFLVDYRDQITKYNNSLIEKDKDIDEYLNQITKLNDVSQKLKSTIDLLEEEKAKDQNTELIKSLNKQIMVYQKKLHETEEKLNILEDEKAHLINLKNTLENKNNALDVELKKLQESFGDKISQIKELQIAQQNHREELAAIMLQSKERDEEIHEIKLQLRKESIENEKLRDSLAAKEQDLHDLTLHIEDNKVIYNTLVAEKDDNSERYNILLAENNRLTEQLTVLENKNKELLEKLKKFAVNFKKKSTMYVELENKFIETQKEIENKNVQIQELLIQVDTIPLLQDKIKHSDEEINRLQTHKIVLDQQKNQDMNQLQITINELQIQYSDASKQVSTLTEANNHLQTELYLSRDEILSLRSQTEMLNKKIAEQEIEQKNNCNLITKMTGLESEINQKQNEIFALKSELENMQQLHTQTQFGYEAKLQERDLYLESLESEVNKYKNRISRFEETISAMEDRRYSLERKADQLGNRLEEKQKAYSEYRNQEDELVSRLAVLMEHDNVVEKQLLEIENENKDLQSKLLIINEENEKLNIALQHVQKNCHTLIDRANTADAAESELLRRQSQLHEMESNYRRLAQDHHFLIEEKKRQIEEIETEFNTQIENSIKEKKILSEKYEKVLEHVSKLEQKLHEYQSNITNLNLNIEELNRENNELRIKSSSVEIAPDYTDQYVSEINNLNSIINKKNDEISILHNNIHTQNINTATLISNLENKTSDLSSRLNVSSFEIERLLNENNHYKQVNVDLQNELAQKNDQLKEIMERNKLTFEMNIPKTEGLIISSTIETMNEEPKAFDFSAIESQIVSDVDIAEAKVKSKKVSENLQGQYDAAGGSIEAAIVPKKAYDCYKGDENTPEIDPFNSDEGWGLGESEEAAQVPADYIYLHEQIQTLKNKNEDLQTELDLNKTRLLKSLKKLKELKSTNDMLSQELQTSKQLSQSVFLDSAIEEELRMNIESLDKKVSELISEVAKEKRDKEALRKQNEVFNNANDRLTEMKEKLENEIELWKYKFKETNDKLAALQWEGDSKETPQHLTSSPSLDENHYKDQIQKIEKENDEMQSLIENLNVQNADLQATQLKLKFEVQHLNDLLNQKNSEQETDFQQLQNNEGLKKQLLELEDRYDKLAEEYKQFIIDSEAKINKIDNEKSVLEISCLNKDKELQNLLDQDSENKIKISALTSELNEKLLFIEEQQTEKDKYSEVLIQCGILDEQCIKLKEELEVAENKISELEQANQTIVQKSSTYEETIDEQRIKIANLNSENDNLLSNVAELRSTLSTAVDQRGLEIAELWKQHLAQRESDFQKIEQDLRQQINTAEAKYEQLLDDVQSSTQDETSKLILAEQMSSLQNKLQDKEDHLQNIQVKYNELAHQLDMLRSDVEDEKVSHDNKLLEQQEEYEKVIQELTIKNQKDLETYQQSFTNIQTELTQTKFSNDEVNEQLVILKNKIIDSEKMVLELTTQLKMKDDEIYQKAHDYSMVLAQRNDEFEGVRKQLLDYEKKVEDISFEKESELAIMRLKLNEIQTQNERIIKALEDEKTHLYEDLEAKIKECTALNKQIVELNGALEEEFKKAVEKQTALENQEIEIISLKDEISTLQNILRTSANKIQKHVSFASDTKPGDKENDESASFLNKELLDAVPRAELDLALYMLHQRDVRCEELTMELTQLLEERDTLQLRLSDSLRSNEDLKAKVKTFGMDSSIDTSSDTISELANFNVREQREQQLVETHRQTSASSSMSEAGSDVPKLQAKLTELRGVKHSRDVRLRQESEQRQLDLRLLQRDVANLPSEAVEQLAQAHHTLSRDSQSTPTVLLNWLRGKSTPKVVHM